MYPTSSNHAIFRGKSTDLKTNAHTSSHCKIACDGDTPSLARCDFCCTQYSSLRATDWVMDLHRNHCCGTSSQPSPVRDAAAGHTEAPVRVPTPSRCVPRYWRRVMYPSLFLGTFLNTENSICSCIRAFRQCGAMPFVPSSFFLSPEYLLEYVFSAFDNFLGTLCPQPCCSRWD